MLTTTQNRIYRKYELYRYEINDIKDPDSIKENFLYESGLFNSYAYSILTKNFPTKITEINIYALNHPELIPFINEDPMLVCSLGIEGLPIRWLIGDGKAFIRSGIIANADSGIELEFRTLINNNTYTGLFNVDKTANTQSFGVSRWDGNFVCWYGNQTTESKSIAMNVGVTYYYKQNRGSIEITSSNGESAVKNFTLGSSSIFPGEFCYPACCRNGNIPTIGGLYESIMVKIYENDVLVRHFIPCQHDNQAGMLDIVSLVFHPNANTSGAFSIEYTLPDGSPWIPIK